MPAKGKSNKTRPGLDRAKVVAAGVSLADSEGVSALTMRGLAKHLGVEAMSLYHHVANKSELLDAMVDAVFAEIDLPEPAEPWREAMRRRAISARAALRAHPWAVGMLDSRESPGPETLRHHDRVIGCLRAGGFSVAAAAQAFSTLDSYIYGFTSQEVALPFDSPEELEVIAAQIIESIPADEYPHLVEMITEHTLRPGYSYAAEFEQGLDLILDGLEKLAD